MLDFFSKVLGYLESFFEYFINILDSLFMGLEILAKSIVFPFELSGFLPSIIGSAMIIVISLVVVKFILGR